MGYHGVLFSLDVLKHILMLGPGEGQDCDADRTRTSGSSAPATWWPLPGPGTESHSAGFRVPGIGLVGYGRSHWQDDSAAMMVVLAGTVRCEQPQTLFFVELHRPGPRIDRLIPRKAARRLQGGLVELGELALRW
jgi:hypothetical protein